MQKLAIGAAQFGLDYGVNGEGEVAAEEVRSILARARSAGMNTIDTAVAYGRSESKLGAAGVADWLVVTKLPPLPSTIDDVRAWVESTFQGSLGRLRLPRTYGLLLHNPADLEGTRGDELYAAVRALQRGGFVEKIGISVYGPDELDRYFAGRDFELVQAPLSVVDRRVVTSGWLAKLSASGVEFHARSVFLQGLLLMTPTARPPRFADWKQVLSAFDDWVGVERMTPVEACLRYALSVPGVTRVVVGVTSVGQLEELLVASAGTVSPPPIELQGPPELVDPRTWAAA